MLAQSSKTGHAYLLQKPAYFTIQDQIIQICITRVFKATESKASPVFKHHNHSRMKGAWL
jgi:hypothetical protein